MSVRVFIWDNKTKKPITEEFGTISYKLIDPDSGEVEILETDKAIMATNKINLEVVLPITELKKEEPVTVEVDDKELKETIETNIDEIEETKKPICVPEKVDNKILQFPIKKES